MNTAAAMDPAFATRRQALAFCAIVGALLLVPAAFRRFDVPSHEARMATAPVRAGPYAFLHRQIYEEQSDIDLAFVGGSLLWSEIDTPAVAAALSAAIGRPARVLTFGWNWHGDDLTYYVLRDLVARRHVKVVVLRLAVDGEVADTPHPQSYRWLTACGHDPVLPTLPWADRAAVYGIEVTGSLRNLLSLLRPNRLESSPFEATLGANPTDLGPGNGPFTPLMLQPPRLTPAHVLSTFGASRTIRWGHTTLGPRQRRYARGYAAAIRDVLDGHRVHVAFVRPPAEAEAHDDSLSADGLWMQTFGLDTTVLAVPPDELFAGLSDEQIAQLYSDHHHFNRNGAELLTPALVPSLLELWTNAADAR
jgi:hypothetical protein